MKLSEKEKFNGCHSREKGAVLYLLFIRRVVNRIPGGLCQRDISLFTGVNAGTINAAVSKWRRRRLICRDATVRDNQAVFAYSLGDEGIEWCRDVEQKRPDVVVSWIERIKRQISTIPRLAVINDMLEIRSSIKQKSINAAPPVKRPVPVTPARTLEPELVVEQFPESQPEQTPEPVQVQPGVQPSKREFSVVDMDMSGWSRRRLV